MNCVKGVEGGREGDCVLVVKLIKDNLENLHNRTIICMTNVCAIVWDNT